MRFLILALLGASTAAASPSTWYVDFAATGPQHDGQTWCTAFLTLQDALGVAQTGDTVRLAGGVYRPDENGDRTAAFELTVDLTLEGGWSGCSAPGERDEVTILSADVDNNDGVPDGLVGSNGYHILRVDGRTSATVIKDLTLAGGMAYGEIASDRRGCAIVGTNASPIVINCNIRTNTAASDGGAVYIDTGAPWFCACLLQYNRADDRGGAFAFVDSAPHIRNGNILQNSAAYGGAIFASNSQVTIDGPGPCGTEELCATNPLVFALDFPHNTASESGGVIYAEGSALIIRNAAFRKNIARTSGGAITARLGSTTDIEGCAFDVNGSGAVGAEGVRGGAISIEEEPPVATRLVIRESGFSNNACNVSGQETYGGAVFLDNARARIVLSRFGCAANDTQSAYYGGAIYVGSGSRKENALPAAEQSAAGSAITPAGSCGTSALRSSICAPASSGARG